MKTVLLWCVCGLGLAILAVNAFTASARYWDLHWCTEGLTSVDQWGKTNCDPPSRVVWAEPAKHWVCKCP
jgi:hypothetical protein